MKKLHYKGRNVYTQSKDTTSIADLKCTEQELGTIKDAYFFELTPDRMVKVRGFDRERIVKETLGLMVDVRGYPGDASVSIAGLENILDFMVETTAIEHGLSSLHGKPVIQYTNENGMKLVGIAFDPDVAKLLKGYKLEKT